MTTGSPRSSSSRNNQHLHIFVAGVCFGFFASSSFFLVLANFEYAATCKKSLLQQQLIPDPTHILNSFDSRKNDKISSSGWKSIDVYFGDESHIADVTTLPTPYFQANQWFSQYRQDEIVSRLLKGKKNGYFIDLASNDAVRISNTFALEHFFGWSGICLEPNPAYWGGLAYRKCHVAAAVLGNQTMDEVEFTFPRQKAPKGGIVGSNFDNSRDRAENVQRRYTVTLKEIFYRFHAPRLIDYLSLDVEGAEDLVMSSFPFEEYRFNILTVERPSESLSGILQTNGYILLKTLKAGKETLWIHESIQRSIDMSALKIDSQNYKYRENNGRRRIAPEEDVP